MPCDDLSAALAHYKDELGFRLDVIFPADAPRVAEMSGHGIQVRLEQSTPGKDEDWGGGRAGMEYRDLIPGRMAGRYIASSIRIRNGGPVPDYVHHHHVRFQMIYCYKGWVKVVYEDQGPPFVMEAGDCVLQPPHIRHRVLASSDNMEVVEVSGPAEHETFVDHDMSLPTAALSEQRDFGGQRFVRHESGTAKWRPGPYDGFEHRDTGILAASNGFASVIVTRPLSEHVGAKLRNNGELFFLFVLEGQATIRNGPGSDVRLSVADPYVVPEGGEAAFVDCSNDFELLQVCTEQ